MVCVVKLFSSKNFVIPLLAFSALVIFINFTPQSPKKIGKTLSDYIQMKKEEQRLFVLESRRILFHGYLNQYDVDQASCVAKLFDVKTKQGVQEFNSIETLLEIETNRGPYQSAEETVMNIINTNFCPDNGLLVVTENN